MRPVSALAGSGGYWYLGSPYSKYRTGLDDAAEVVSTIAGHLIARGVAVYSPIAHSHAIARASGLDPLDHGLWLPVDRPLAEAAQGLIVACMEGWQESYGVGEEIRWFSEMRKPRYALMVQPLQIYSLP